jgi:hypothetical protein
MSGNSYYGGIPYKIHLEINRVPSLKSLFHLRDRDVGVSFKLVEIADSVFAEERAGHRAVKSDTQRQLSDDREAF